MKYDKLDVYLISNEDIFLFKTMTSREGDIYESCHYLTKAYADLKDEGLAIQYPKEKMGKLAQAIANRVARVSYESHANNYLVESNTCDRLLKQLEREFNVKPRRPKKNLEGTVAAVGLIGGLLFLSPTITGNVIGNASVGVSSVVGALFFLVGLAGVWIWVRNR